LGVIRHVKVSIELPEYTADCDGVRVLRNLKAVRSLAWKVRSTRHEASTGELSGSVRDVQETKWTKLNTYTYISFYLVEPQ
jgi:GDPmannose 4,6-dehydratase